MERMEVLSCVVNYLRRRCLYRSFLKVGGNFEILVMDYTFRKNKYLKTWRVSPSHDWYKRSSPGGSIGLACDRAGQTVLSRSVSGHLRSCSFSHGNKVFPVCAKCGVASASPEHILSCLRLSRETFETDPLLALDFLRLSGLMDGV
ncbi:hypothetical protein AVEN_109139-1 [Araneus ventricosus]|uniref:Uncharacterized protein n=1 Tax=Araneus ventricosus TaxID=182803 RepID=A0A4Y2KHQ9_ARAVE|nr:hypothetical protein AVEN_109139-1 [Araneus ventricosus]